MKKKGTKVTSNVVSTKPMEPASNKNIDAPLHGGVGNKPAPINYKKGSAK